jgi:hypothetical protein
MVLHPSAVRSEILHVELAVIGEDQEMPDLT